MKSEFSKGHIFTLIILSLIIFNSCRNTGYMSAVKNVAAIYNPSSSPIHPEYSLYHISDSVSNLFFSIDTRELHYNSANPLNKEFARVKIHYRVFSSFVDRSYFDSTSVIFNIYQLSGKDRFTTFLPLPLPTGRSYSIEITTTDLLNQATNLQYLFTNKSDLSSVHNFLITGLDGKPLINRYIDSVDSISIENKRLKTDIIYAGFTEIDRSLPLPPFSLTRYKDFEVEFDSVWVWNVADKPFSSIEKEGIYFFSVDSDLNSGVAVYKMTDFFPVTKTPLSVLEPLQYLTTGREFRNLEEMNNNKLAVDSFWLAVSGNINRSKELIRVYYSRITFANKYFSSYKEGWRTDRGMIYSIFGPPKTIYISEDSERWIYGENNNLISMDFYFEKKKHLLTDNNYVLSRQEVYKGSWYQAVDTWRNGRVYSVLK